jgi:hypothetical protein
MHRLLAALAVLERWQVASAGRDGSTASGMRPAPQCAILAGDMSDPGITTETFRRDPCGLRPCTLYPVRFDVGVLPLRSNRKKKSSGC